MAAVVKDGEMIALPAVPLVGSLLGATRTVVERTVATATFAVSVPARAEALLDNVESLIRRVDAVVDDAAVAVARVEAIIASTTSVVADADAVAGQARTIVGQVGTVATQAEAIVGDVGTVAGQARTVVGEVALVAGEARTIIDSAGRSADIASELLETYEPLARQAAPLAAQFIEELSPEEVHAAILMLDRLPELSERMNMIMPILGTLDTVADTLFAFSRVVIDDPQLRRTLNDRGASVEGRRDIVSRLLDAQVDDVSLALARQAVAMRKHGYEETLVAFAEDAISREGRLQARVVTAYALDDDEKQRLAGALARKYGRDVHVDVTVDPSVIGGLSVEIAGERIDSTIQTRLADARRALVG